MAKKQTIVKSFSQIAEVLAARAASEAAQAALLKGGNAQKAAAKAVRAITRTDQSRVALKAAEKAEAAMARKLAQRQAERRQVDLEVATSKYGVGLEAQRESFAASLQAQVAEARAKREAIAAAETARVAAKIAADKAAAEAREAQKFAEVREFVSRCSEGRTVKANYEFAMRRAMSSNDRELVAAWMAAAKIA